MVEGTGIVALCRVLACMRPWVSPPALKKKFVEVSKLVGGWSVYLKSDSRVLAFNSSRKWLEGSVGAGSKSV